MSSAEKAFLTTGDAVTWLWRRHKAHWPTPIKAKVVGISANKVKIAPINSDGSEDKKVWVKPHNLCIGYTKTAQYNDGGNTTQFSDE